MAKQRKGPQNRPAVRQHPQRMCIACREAGGKRDLLRLVRVDEGVIVDDSGKMAGRGAYVHPQTLCWDKALAGSLLQKALRTKISSENLQALSASVSAQLQMTSEPA